MMQNRTELVYFSITTTKNGIKSVEKWFVIKKKSKKKILKQRFYLAAMHSEHHWSWHRLHPIWWAWSPLRTSFLSMQSPQFDHEQFQYHDHRMHSTPIPSIWIPFPCTISVHMPKSMWFYQFPVARKTANVAIDFDRWILKLQLNRGYCDGQSYTANAWYQLLLSNGPKQDIMAIHLHKIHDYWALASYCKTNGSKLTALNLLVEIISSCEINSLSCCGRYFSILCESEETKWILKWNQTTIQGKGTKECESDRKWKFTMANSLCSVNWTSSFRFSTTKWNEMKSN